MASFKNFIHSELTNLAQFLRARTTTVVFTIGFTFTLVIFAIVASVNSTENFPFTPYRPWHARIFSSPGNFSAILSLNFHRLAACPNVRCKNRTDIAGSLYYRPENTDVRLLKNFTAVSKRSSENDILQDSDRCDIFDGKWVVDNTYPSYLPGSCPYVDDAFNCFRNGRPDSGYQRLRWQPKGCHIPRLDGKDMLERLGGKRLVFVGDSLNRNMWQSMVCMLRNSLDDKSRVLDVSPKQHFRNEAFYAFRFVDFNSTVEYFRSPFLVQEWKMVNPTGTRKETLRLDMIQRSSSKYKDADIIVFNTGHWWTHEKTSRGKDYYQEGDHVYSKMKVAEAYSKALRTWAKWVESNVDSSRTRVFFRGYSASHFRGGRWNSGGNCDGETEPITNDTYVTEYPHKMNILESVIGEMKTPVFYLNVTRMTDYRKDAHPSVYRLPYNASNKRENIQDCSHWCLPGVPDAWNELLYTSLFFPGKDFRLTHR